MLQTAAVVKKLPGQVLSVTAAACPAPSRGLQGSQAIYYLPPQQDTVHSEPSVHLQPGSPANTGDQEPKKDTVQCSAVQCSAVQCSAVQFSAPFPLQWHTNCQVAREDEKVQYSIIDVSDLNHKLLRLKTCFN